MKENEFKEVFGSEPVYTLDQLGQFLVGNSKILETAR